MNTIEKTKIQSLVNKYCDGFESANQAAKSLIGVSSGTLSQIRNNNWTLISEKMWQNIAKQVGYVASDWIDVETENYLSINELLTDAKENSRVHSLIGVRSWGKDTGIRGFKADNKNVFQVNCSALLNEKYLLIEILKSMGCNLYTNAYKLEQELISRLNKLEKPLLIINEYEKLKPTPFKYLITLCNLLEDKCGIVVVGTPYLRERIVRGVDYQKPGYDEINSRLGSRFIELEKPTRKDILLMCRANGVTDHELVSEIYKEYVQADFDLRRVKKLIKNESLKAKEEVAA